MKCNVSRFYKDDASRLIWSFIYKKYAHLGVDLEELYEAGYEGYLLGARKVGMEITKDTITYLYTCIMHEIHRALHKEMEYTRSVYRDQELYEDTVKIFVDDEDSLEDVVGIDLLVEDIAKHLHKLNEREQYIISNLYLDGREEHSVVEIADMWGVSRQHVSKMAKDALAKLATFIAD